MRASIGFFDSGIGGLSVYRACRALLPRTPMLYYADTKNVPYGDKTATQIQALSNRATRWLIKHGAKMIVVACNSASAHALENLRADFAIPVVGLVPAIKPACAYTQSQKIGVLATKATLQGKLFAEVVRQFALPQGVQVHSHFDARLALWVEQGMVDGQVANDLQAHLANWRILGIDTVVLGCTHYPFFANLVRSMGFVVIDSNEAVARRVASLWQYDDSGQDGYFGFYASAPQAHLPSAIHALLDGANTVHIDWLI